MAAKSFSISSNGVGQRHQEKLFKIRFVRILEIFAIDVHEITMFHIKPAFGQYIILNGNVIPINSVYTNATAFYLYQVPTGRRFFQNIRQNENPVIDKCGFVNGVYALPINSCGGDCRLRVWQTFSTSTPPGN